MTNTTNPGRPAHFATGSLPALADVTGMTGAGAADGSMARALAALPMVLANGSCEPQTGFGQNPAFDPLPLTADMFAAAFAIDCGVGTLALLAELAI